MLRGDARAITITGPAGVGKTRLAIDVAEALLAEGRFTEVWRCDLGDARDAASLCDAVGQAIGASSGKGGPAGLGAVLDARGDALLVLDEMEGVAPIAAEIVASWLAAAPSSALLVTSRAPLGIAEEHVFELGPLALPPQGRASGDAVEMFVRQAQRARPGYTLTEAEAPFVSALVTELDGLPLAIELCAPRMAVMGARALLHRMSSRFDLLKKQGARAGDRHATLALAIDASYQTLSPEEQSALAQCAVFRGGFTLEAAEAVVDLEAFGGASVIDALTSLRQRSLLCAADALVPGELRLTMLSGVRAFAIEKLSPEDRAAACERHAHHVVRAAEEHERKLHGKDGAHHRARVLAERENLLEVIERVLGRGPVSARAAEPALRALLVLAAVAPETGPLETFVRALDPVLTATKDSGADPRLSARALHARGALLLSRGDVKSGNRDLVRALAVARTLHDAPLDARCTLALGEALARRGEATAAREHFQLAADTFLRIGDAPAAATAIASLAEATYRAGRFEEGVALAERALSMHRAHADPIGEANDRVLLARFAADRDDLPAARAHLDEARLLARAASSARVEAIAEGWLGFVDVLAGMARSRENKPIANGHDGDAACASDVAAAGRLHLERAAASLGAMGLVPLEALFTGLLGVAQRIAGDDAEAFARLVAVTGPHTANVDDAHAALFLWHFAELERRIGRTDEAAATRERAREPIARSGDPTLPALFALVDPSPSSRAEALAIARSFASRSAHVRVAIALQSEDDRGSIAPPPPPPDDALIVGPSGLWFRAPNGERVALDRRRQLAKMLDRLADERIANPSAALGWDALLAAAWPGERVLPEAAAHRVRVAISTLRKMGLRDLLRTSEDGYLLTSDVLTVRGAD